MAMSSRRVLVVDDESSIRTILADVFRAEGYLVSTAANGLVAAAVPPHDYS